MQVGERFTARVAFPDPGLYWYHPHIREDYGKEMGLYGNVLVEPAEADYWPQVNREIVITLDDILLEDGRVAPFSREETTHSAMGRFGDVMLVGGETDLSDRPARRGRPPLPDQYRQHPGVQGRTADARMKVVGADSGRVEQEELVDAVILAPSERAIVDVLFDTAGELTLEHHTPDQVYPLATIRVSEDRATPALEEQFSALRANPDMAMERERIPLT